MHVRQSSADEWFRLTETANSAQETHMLTLLWHSGGWVGEQPTKGPAILYVFKCQSFAKIGYAKNPWRRLLSMQIGNPYEITTHSLWASPAAEYAEKLLHYKFQGYRVRGEWFSDEVLTFFGIQSKTAVLTCENGGKPHK